MTEVKSGRPPGPASLRRRHVIAVKLDDRFFEQLALRARTDDRPLASLLRVLVARQLDAEQGAAR